MLACFVMLGSRTLNDYDDDNEDDDAEYVYKNNIAFNNMNQNDFCPLATVELDPMIPIQHHLVTTAVRNCTLHDTLYPIIYPRL